MVNLDACGASFAFGEHQTGVQSARNDWCFAIVSQETVAWKPNLLVWCTQEALSVARVRGTGYVRKKGLQAMAYGGGRCFRDGLRPDHGLRPRPLTMWADAWLESMTSEVFASS